MANLLRLNLFQVNWLKELEFVFVDLKSNYDFHFGFKNKEAIATMQVYIG